MTEQLSLSFKTVMDLRGILLITITSPREKGECLEAKEQDLV